MYGYILAKHQLHTTRWKTRFPIHSLKKNFLSQRSWLSEQRTGALTDGTVLSHMTPHDGGSSSLEMEYGSLVWTPVTVMLDLTCKRIEGLHGYQVIPLDIGLHRFHNFLTGATML